MTAYFTPSEITLHELRGSPYKQLVASELAFVDTDGVRWAAPLGTWTDGASVPRLALAITDGRFSNVFQKAAVVHDAYCQEINKDRCPPYRSRSWRDTHKMFHQACLAGGTPRLRARLMFSAVSWFGPRWNDPESQARQVPPDLARVGFAATKQWIENSEPDLAEIEASIADREGIINEISRLQFAAIGAMERNDSKGAEAKLREAESPIARGLDRAPGDLMFLNLQGYQHKNWAMLRPDRLEAELDKAADLFERVLAVEPRDASALNGLGSVAILRDDLDKAEQFIRRALEEEPEYAAAWQDLQLLYRIRASRPREE